MWNRSLSKTEVGDVMSRKLDSTDVGLVGYWPFEEGEGVLSLDKSIYSNYASLIFGATWVKLPAYDKINSESESKNSLFNSKEISKKQFQYKPDALLINTVKKKNLIK